MVYAYVMYHQLEVGLNFLSSVPGPTGKSALDYVLVEWCGSHHLFTGSYERKVRFVTSLVTSAMNYES